MYIPLTMQASARRSFKIIKLEKSMDNSYKQEMANKLPKVKNLYIELACRL